MKTQLKIAALCILITFSTFVSAAQKPKLIEFGWDYPNVDFLSKNLGSMQNTPFDGICFSLQQKIMEAFDTAVHNDVYFEYNKLNTLEWGKYSDNFVILRGFGITGGRWFDDDAWKIFAKNMNGLSKAMLSGTIKGILFDPEYYYPDKLYNPWTYTKAQYPHQSFEEVQAAAKKKRIRLYQCLTGIQNRFFIYIYLAGQPYCAGEKVHTHAGHATCTADTLF